MIQPTPEQIRLARRAARLTQVEAAALAGYGNRQRWVELESGIKTMDAVRWRYFLHCAGISRITFKPLKRR